MSFDCPVCLEPLKNLEKICGEDCGHIICGKCYDHMYKDCKKVNCPVCRIPLVSVNKPADKRALALSTIVSKPVKVRKVAQPIRCVGGRCKVIKNPDDMFLYNFSIGDFDFDY